MVTAPATSSKNENRVGWKMSSNVAEALVTGANAVATNRDRFRATAAVVMIGVVVVANPPNDADESVVVLTLCAVRLQKKLDGSPTVCGRV